MKLSKSNIVLAAACAALLGTTGWLYTQNHRNKKAISELNTRIDDLSEKERQSVVVQSISKQMEEIAYQQKEISEEQRLEAVAQTELANKMRNQSEVERKNALIARQNALEAERNAKDAYATAEAQRKTAETERNNANLAYHRADTLRLQSLAVTVANLATTRYQTGNKELGALLAYTAYTLMKENGGDVRYPDIYQALSVTFGGISKWNYNKGALTCISCTPSWEKIFVTGSSYGDLHWQKFDQMKLQHKQLFSDNAYDWRDVLYAEDDHIYALSRTGHLYYKEGDKPHIIFPLPAINYCKILRQGRYLVLVADNDVSWFDCRQEQPTSNVALDFTVSTAGVYKGRPCLFGKDGTMHLLDEHHRVKATKQPCKGVVSAFFYDDKSGLSGYGTSNGHIYLVSDNGQQLHLLGHRSRISGLAFINSSVYSSSYDGTIKAWNLEQARTEPMTLYDGKQWVQCFFVQKKEDFLWAGAADGALIDAAISPDVMADKLKENFKRNMTRDEWNAYVGEHVPYRTYVK